MTDRIVSHGFAALAALALVLMVAVPAVAQTAPPRIVDSNAGDLYVVYSSSRFPLVPDEISDSDLAALNHGGEIHGALQTTAPQVVDVVEATDGTLYVVRYDTAWTLIPDSISDSALATLTPAGEINGSFTVPATTTASTPKKTAPPAELVGKWERTRDTGAGMGSWIGDSYDFQSDGSFVHAGRFVYGVDMQTYETGTMVVNSSRLRLDTARCEMKKSQFEQFQPCPLQSQMFGWQVGRNELGYRVLILMWPDGTRDEFHPIGG